MGNLIEIWWDTWMVHTSNYMGVVPENWGDTQIATLMGKMMIDSRILGSSILIPTSQLQSAARVSILDYNDPIINCLVSPIQNIQKKTTEDWHLFEHWVPPNPLAPHHVLH